jgi:hypothetical protein
LRCDRGFMNRYSESDVRGKAACKRAIQEKLGLAVAPEKPLLVFIGRCSRERVSSPVVRYKAGGPRGMHPFHSPAVRAAVCPARCSGSARPSGAQHRHELHTVAKPWAG